MAEFEKFDLKKAAKNGENYLISMVDENNDYLPYWYVQVNMVPAFAKHVRVDDAELVASWYEAVSCTMRILGTGADEKAAVVKEAFKRHLKKSWGVHGLRFHEPYPWSNRTHASFHEMGWVLSGINRVLEDEPDNAEFKMLAENLVNGLKGLVYERKIKTFWNGDYDFSMPIYEFPSDLYMKEGGFDPERVTGRGEACVRNAVLLQPLVVFYERFGSAAALDLARGIANYMIELSRYFNWEGAFFGHVHSAVWFAIGLLQLGKVTGEERYFAFGYKIYCYVKSISSEYGWVPEYAQWHPMSETHCETCCIKDMIECALVLIDSGYNEWELVDKYTRNQLIEQQFSYGGFAAVEQDREDRDGYTWRDMDKRILGGWSGGGEANYISLTKFRAIAGCCVGTAPQALWMVWDRIIRREDRCTVVNLPMECENEYARVEIGYPNQGLMRIALKKDGDCAVRVFSWMGGTVSLAVNGEIFPVRYKDGCLFVPGLQAGDVVELSHSLRTEIKKEMVQQKEYTVYWRGSDVIKIEPEGEHLKLYQRQVGTPKDYPPKIGLGETEHSFGPTQQKK